MKKPVLVFFVAGLVLLSTVIWFIMSLRSFRPVDMVHFGVIILVIGFALFVGVKRLGNYKRGEPPEDELSKKVLQKTAAISYYISLYIWVFLIFLKDRVTFDTEELLGTGILAMAVTFGITWFVLNFRGIRNG
jgi:peptidoglycan/LPS O-acetylase OafA/YrhL